MKSAVQTILCILAVLMSILVLAGCSSQPEASPQQIGDRQTVKKAHDRGQIPAQYQGQSQQR